jgi:phosphoribosyl 1,2-cyclic phosphodiesterase
MDDGRFTVRFWGVRGSYPVPGLSTLLFGGNTACVEVRVGEHLVILDAGTGIIGLGRKLARQNDPVVATLLFSHTHHDHTQGFPFFEPADRESTVLYMFGPRDFGQSIEESLGRAMLAPTFPIRINDLKSLRLIGNFTDESQVLLLGNDHECRLENVHHRGHDIPPEAVQIHLLRSYAHPNGVNVYRISWQGKSLVYATDTESYVGGDTRLIAFARDADLLIHDAQYMDDEYVAAIESKQGWGHSTHSMALAACKQASVKRLAFFHHDPSHCDEQLLRIERSCQSEFPQCFMAAEGLTLTL